MNAIELSHVTKHFPGFTLQDLSLTVPSGTICGLVGETAAPAPSWGRIPPRRSFSP